MINVPRYSVRILEVPVCTLSVRMGLRWGLQEERFLHGVDVTQSDYLARPAVMEVLAFAESAHQGQLRRTGDPYIRHCVETAFITEQLMILDKKVEDARCRSRLPPPTPTHTVHHFLALTSG